MEPFRPLVDWKVKQLVDEGKTEVTPEVKKHLAGILKLDLPTLRGKSCLSICLLNLAQSLVKSFEHKKSYEYLFK